MTITKTTVESQKGHRRVTDDYRQVTDEYRQVADNYRRVTDESHRRATRNFLGQGKILEIRTLRERFMYSMQKKSPAGKNFSVSSPRYS